jgi:tRNA A58 N-methylase Trm61
MRPMNIFQKRTKFLGGGLMHRPTEVYFIEQILFHNKFQRIVEFGTMAGRLTLLFGIYALQRKGSVITFDIRKEPKHPAWKAIKPVLPIEFYRMDIFSQEVQVMVDDYMKDHMTLIYCDNGKKKDEFNMYAHLLKPGDFIMAHDRPNEIKYRDIEDTVEACDLEPMYEEYVKTLKVTQFCFRKRCHYSDD